MVCILSDFKNSVKGCYIHYANTTLVYFANAGCLADPENLK